MIFEHYTDLAGAEITLKFEAIIGVKHIEPGDNSKAGARLMLINGNYLLVKQSYNEIIGNWKKYV